MPLSARIVLGTTLVALLSAPARPAEADERGRCLAAHRQGQEHRKQDRVLEARADFGTCARDMCPRLVRRDCVAWLRDLEESTPSIVVSARTKSGVDLRDGQLSIDGDPIDKGQTGKPIDVNPGEHRVKLVLPDARVIEQAVVVNLGEKNRLVKLVVPDPPIAEADASAKGGLREEDASPIRLPPPKSAASPLPWILGGVSLAAIAGGLTLDLMGSSDVRSLRSDCAPGCADSDVSGARTKILIGDGLLIAGVIAGVAAVYLALKQPASPPRTTPVLGMSFH